MWAVGGALPHVLPGVVTWMRKPLAEGSGRHAPSAPAATKNNYMSWGSGEFSPHGPSAFHQWLATPNRTTARTSPRYTVKLPHTCDLDAPRIGRGRDDMYHTRALLSSPPKSWSPHVYMPGRPIDRDAEMVERECVAVQVQFLLIFEDTF